MISMKILEIKLPNRLRLKPGSTAEQEITIQNDGRVPWPSDTTLVYQGTNNVLNVPEQVITGSLDPGQTYVFRFQLNMPLLELNDKIDVTYELCYNNQT